ncbi:MAG TPA: hypothetical protein VHF51_00405, partial [Solirubrobacteraceae bacterium]|nr:hypothetical protein [Solirubrobacteraceae bacterium]
MVDLERAERLEEAADVLWAGARLEPRHPVALCAAAVGPVLPAHGGREPLEDRGDVGAAPAGERRPIFRWMCATWCCTVRGESASRAAISLFISPAGQEAQHLDLAVGELARVRPAPGGRVARRAQDRLDRLRAQAARRAASAR